MEDLHRSRDELVSVLTGTHVRVWPYAPGIYPVDTLPRCWALLCRSGQVGKVFWNCLHPETLTLMDFLRLMERALLYIVEDRTSGQVAGVCWFDEVLWQYRAAITVWYARPYRGGKAREGTRIVLEYGFQAHQWHSIWAYTPWRTAVRHGEAVGAKVQATLPGYAPGGKDVYVLKKERDYVRDTDGPRGPHDTRRETGPDLCV